METPKCNSHATLSSSPMFFPSHFPVCDLTATPSRLLRSRKDSIYYPHFTDGNTGGQRAQETCPGSLGELGSEVGPDTRTKSPPWPPNMIQPCSGCTHSKSHSLNAWWDHTVPSSNLVHHPPLPPLRCKDQRGMLGLCLLRLEEVLL